MALVAPQIGGGCPFLYTLSAYSKGASIRPACLPSLRSSIFSLSGQIFSKKGKNKLFFGGAWCFLGILGDQKGQNLIYF